VNIDRAISLAFSGRNSISIIDKLRQRKLVQWAVAYLAGGWLLLQVITLVGNEFNWPSVVGRTAIVIVGVGFLAALVLAWYHGEQGRQRASSMELLLLAGVLLIAGTAVFAVTRNTGDVSAALTPDDNVDSKSVAVLPLKTITNDDESRAFAGGVHDEILTQLARIGALRVTSRTSVQQYAETDKSMRQIARELGVATVLEGSVQRAGDRVRVQAQLIDADTDAHLWAHTYTGNFSQIFEFQSDIAQQIATALAAQLSTAERSLLTRVPTASTDAWDAYVTGRAHLLRPEVTEANLQGAQRYFERALEFDSAFAEAHAQLSFTHGRMLWWGYDTSEARRQLMWQQARVALRLQPDIPESHIAMAYAHYYGSRAYAEALRELRAALEISPGSSDIVLAMGFIQRRQGDWQASIDNMTLALRADPRNTYGMRDLGDALIFMNRFDEGIRVYNHALAIAPDNYTVARQKGWAYLRYQGELDTLRAVVNAFRHLDATASSESPVYDRYTLALLDRDFDAALAAAREGPEVYVAQTHITPRALMLGLATLWSGRPASAALDSARVLLQRELKERPNDVRVHMGLAQVFAGLGQKDAAIRHINAAVRQPEVTRDALLGAYGRPIARVYAMLGDAENAVRYARPLMQPPVFLTAHEIRLDPGWDRVRDDPRVRALLQ
jgi:TolB-like protein/Flp pilus assembly protein TadD